MPRPPAVPLKGTFDSRTGIYNFDGYSYKARWYANALQIPIDDCKAIVETGHKRDMPKYPQSILVVGEDRWKQIEKSYPSWVGLTQFHYYAPDVNPGELPAWLQGIQAHGTKLIHEKSPGVVYLLTYAEEDYIYRYFVDSAPAPDYTPAPPPAPGGGGTAPPLPLLTFSELEITGTIGDQPIDLLFKFK